MDIPVLKYIDILIGLSLVMVLVSTVVLAMTQVLLNTTFARARHLQRGLSRLVTYVDPALSSGHAWYLSRLLVRHPMVGQPTMFGPLRRLTGWLRGLLRALRKADVTPLPPLSPGSVVHREELAYLLIEFAAGEGPLVGTGDQETMPIALVETQQALAKALAAGGVADPAAMLRAIRLKTVEHERAEPDEPSNRWRANAVADCGPNDFIAKLYASFDATMARVTDAFSAESSLWVSAVALLVAVALQLDSFALIKRLSVDDEYRATFVELAKTIDEDKAQIEASQVAEGERAVQLASNEQNMTQARESLALLGSPSINLLPRLAKASEPWGRLGVYLPDMNQVPGVLLSWVLLSLGAPFWFDALKNLLNLRSRLAKKDEADREQRATAQSGKPRA